MSDFPAAAASSSQTSDCSYVSLLRHLKLSSGNELSIMRPVKHWRTSTVVLINMVLSGILEVVSVCSVLFVCII